MSSVIETLAAYGRIMVRDLTPHVITTLILVLVGIVAAVVIVKAIEFADERWFNKRRGVVENEWSKWVKVGEAFADGLAKGFGCSCSAADEKLKKFFVYYKKESD